MQCFKVLFEGRGASQLFHAAVAAYQSCDTLFHPVEVIQLCFRTVQDYR